MDLVSAYKVVGIEGENVSVHLDLMMDRFVVQVDGEQAIVSYERDEVLEFLKLLAHGLE